MPLTEPAVRFSRNGLFISIPINNPKYRNYGESLALEEDVFEDTY